VAIQFVEHTGTAWGLLLTVILLCAAVAHPPQARAQEIRTPKLQGGAFTGHTNIVNSVSFSPDGTQALSGSWDGTVKLWDIVTGRNIRAKASARRVFAGHTGPVWTVCFSPDGTLALSGSVDTTIKLWDIATGREIRTFTGHTRSVNSVCFSPDGKHILSGSVDETVKLWEITR